MSVLKTSISREAHTTYQTLGIADDTALLACDLHTGRTHQIRVHLSSIGHPILGDPTYGSSQSVKMTQAYSVAGMCLHSWKLKFVSPESDHKIDVDAPLPENFKDVMDNVGLVLHP